MTNRRFESTAAAGTGLLALIVALAGPAPAFAQGTLKPVQAQIVNTTASPVPVTIVSPVPTPPNPLGVPLADHVVLAWGSFGAGSLCGGSQSFSRMRPNGVPDDERFVVPAGRTLAVTDVDAVVVSGIGQTFQLGRTVHAVLVMSEHVGTGVYMSHLSNGVTMTTATAEAVAVSSTLRTPVLIGAGQEVCVRGDSRGALGGFLDHDVTNATVRGYLF